MIQAPTLENFKQYVLEQPFALHALVFAPAFSKSAKEVFLPRLDYLDSQSKGNIHFYMAGYGAYPNEQEKWTDARGMAAEFPNDKFLAPWFYSTKAFSNFIDSMRAETTWEYSSQETEMIILDRAGNYQEALILDINTMVSDGAIGGAGQILQSLINYSSQIADGKSTFGYSDSNAFGVFGNAILGAFKGAEGLYAAWKKGRHFAIRDIRKPEA